MRSWIPRRYEAHSYLEVREVLIGAASIAHHIEVVPGVVDHGVVLDAALLIGNKGLQYRPNGGARHQSDSVLESFKGQ